MKSFNAATGKTLSKSDFDKNLSTVLPNAKDWNGIRKLRTPATASNVNLQ